MYETADPELGAQIHPRTPEMTEKKREWVLRNTTSSQQGEVELTRQLDVKWIDFTHI